MNWLTGMERKAGAEINPIVGLCGICSKKIYRHELALGATKDYCAGCHDEALERILEEFYKRNKERIVS